MLRRLTATIICSALYLSGCGGAGEVPDVAGSSAQIYAAAIFDLATARNTFGPGHRFAELLVVDATVADIVATYGSGAHLSKFTPAERDAITAALSPLSPMRFIADQTAWRTDELQPVIPGSAILALGPIEQAGDDIVHVGVSLWCSGVCGFWTTLVIELVDGAWVVTGTTGESVIS